MLEQSGPEDALGVTVRPVILGANNVQPRRRKGVDSGPRGISLWSGDLRTDVDNN